MADGVLDHGGDGDGSGGHAGDFADFTPEALAALEAKLQPLLAPYTLDAAGTGPLAPEPASTQLGPETEPSTFVVLLQAANGSGVYGAAEITCDQASGILTVDLAAFGLTPGVAHAVHIHGFSDDRPSLLPNASLDKDGDGFVEDQEGDEVVGPVILALTTDGEITDATRAAAFPVADANGRLLLRETYRPDLSDPGQMAIFEEFLDRLTGRELQIHGLEVAPGTGAGTPNEINGTGGYRVPLPVANGIMLPLGEDTAEVAGLLHSVWDEASGADADAGPAYEGAGTSAEEDLSASLPSLCNVSSNDDVL